MRELKVQLTELSEEVSSKSTLGKAVSYALNHWNGQRGAARRTTKKGEPKSHPSRGAKRVRTCGDGAEACDSRQRSWRGRP
ncbi:hypothetical protein J4T87_0026190 (plasmid) [Rhizobium sp. T1473]|uniref:IS66 family transposase n=1 Tax=Rhizobium sp. T1473 TaxID=555321 RepID=UPI0021E61D7D|nr:IS66 family transposase [Rhizobium sp. T1473]